MYIYYNNNVLWDIDRSAVKETTHTYSRVVVLRRKNNESAKLMCGVADVAELRQRKADLPRVRHEFDELRRRRRGGPRKNGLRIGRNSKVGGEGVGSRASRAGGRGTGPHSRPSSVVGFDPGSAHFDEHVRPVFFWFFL